VEAIRAKRRGSREGVVIVVGNSGHIGEKIAPLGPAPFAGVSSIRSIPCTAISVWFVERDVVLALSASARRQLLDVLPRAQSGSTVKIIAFTGDPRSRSRRTPMWCSA